MQEIGLVNARQGRGGTKLSDKGEAFLKQHNEVSARILEVGSDLDKLILWCLLIYRNNSDALS